MLTSITKKVIMSVTGLFLILFLTLHVVANLTILWGPEVYLKVTDFMGTNPLIQVMVGFGPGFYCSYRVLLYHYAA